jgi:hypothetical protein
MLDSGKPKTEFRKTTQTQRDQAETQKRVDLCGPLFQVMAERLRPFPKDSLIQAANVVSKARGLKKPDRLCARGRVALIAFFCSTFPDFPDGFPALSNYREGHHLAVPRRQRPPPPVSDSVPGSPAGGELANGEIWGLAFDDFNPFQ